jgi:hypothetical protein
MTEEEKVTRMWTGDKDGPLPPPEEEFVPECAVPATSFRITRSALMKMFALAKSVQSKLGGVEAYCIMLSDREDLTVTDILIPRHEASGGFVRVDAVYVDEVRDRLREMNENGGQWEAVGWSHSHGTMGVFFSGTDWENQKALLDSAGKTTQRFGETYLTVYGMTVNVREQIYAEILSRMKCGAEIRQRGATLHIVEDVNGDDEAIRDEIYEEVAALVDERVSKLTFRRRWKSKDKKSYYSTTEGGGSEYEYEEAEAEDITAEDLVDEIREGARGPKGLLRAVNKSLQLKKIFSPMEGKAIAKSLIKVIKEARKELLDDVEKLVYGEELESGGGEEGPEDGGGDERYSSLPADRLIEYIESTRDKELTDFGSFCDELKAEISDEETLRYLSKNKSLIREELENRGYEFGAAESPNGGEAGQVGFEEYLKFLSEGRVNGRTLEALRERIEDLGSVEIIAQLQPEGLAAALSPSPVDEGQANNLIGQTKHYLKKIDRNTDADFSYLLDWEGYGNPPSDIDDIAKKMQELAEEGVTPEAVARSGEEGLSELLGCNTPTASWVIEATLEELDEEEVEVKDEEIRDHRRKRLTRFVDGMPITRYTKQKLLPYLEEYSAFTLSRLDRDELEERFGARGWEIRVIRDSTEEIYGYKHEGDELTDSDLVEELPIDDSSTKSMLRNFVDNGHELSELLEMSEDELKTLLGCHELTAAAILKKLRDREAEPEGDPTGGSGSAPDYIT